MWYDAAACASRPASKRPHPLARALQDMDIYYYQFWVAFFQIILTALLSPLTYIFQSPDGHVSHMPGSVLDGLKCW